MFRIDSFISNEHNFSKFIFMFETVYTLGNIQLWKWAASWAIYL